MFELVVLQREIIAKDLGDEQKPGFEIIKVRPLGLGLGGLVLMSESTPKIELPIKIERGGIEGVVLD